MNKINDKYKKEFVKDIEEALKFHSNYSGDYTNNSYLPRMDYLVAKYGITGNAPAPRVSNMLSIYYEMVNVKNIHEALERLKEGENND